MSGPRERASLLLEEHPDAKEPLEDILERDEEGPWAFDDIPVDSGTFGEIVSQDLVEKTNGSYRLVDRDAIRAVLYDETPAADEQESRIQERRSFKDRIPSIEWAQLAIVGVALAAVAGIRIAPMLGSVFRDGAVVLPANDPYYYRYWVTTLAETGGNPFDASTLNSLPDGVATRDTLLIVGLWILVDIFGSAVAPEVVAWYPPIAAVVCGFFVYLTAVRVTSDRRVGIAAVAFLAAMPTHALRSALGFSDHHALDYVWVSALTYGLVVLGTRSERVETRYPQIAAAGLLAIGITGQSAAWRGAPIHLAPLGAVVVGLVAMDVAADRHPIQSNIYLLGGLTAGAVLTGGIHLALGWMSTYVAVAPGLLAVGSWAVVGLGAISYQINVSVRMLLGVEFLFGLIAGVGSWFTLPPFRSGISEFLTYMQLTTGGTIAETKSLIAGQNGSIFGPVLFLGLTFFLAVPILGRETLRIIKDQGGDQLVPVILAWYFFILSILQVRFAGQFGLFVALFGGIGFIALSEAVDILEEDEKQDRNRMARQINNNSNIRDVNLLGRRKLLTLSGLFAFVWLPGAALSGAKMSQVMISQEAFNTARAIKEHAEERGYSYPENYVWISWDQSRMFNTFVNGEADSVEFAHSYDEFLRSERPQDWYSRMDESVGYVVIEQQSGEFNLEDATTYARLFKRHGSRSDPVSGLGRFRLIHVSDESEYKAFSYVPGAVIAGSVEPQETVTVETEVTVSGQTFSYQRQIQADGSGRFQVRVPYAGQYRVSDRTVAVSETAVTQGAEVSIANNTQPVEIGGGDSNAERRTER